MKFVRVVYGMAAAYGFIVLSISYFLLEEVGRNAPPAVTHPEFYYGFIGAALLWQPVFVLIARDPMRYRSLIPITVLEKLVYTVPVVILYVTGRVPSTILVPSLVDPIFGVLFVLAYFRMVPRNDLSQNTASGAARIRE